MAAAALLQISTRPGSAITKLVGGLYTPKINVLH